jgi:hypothetical protein
MFTRARSHRQMQRLVYLDLKGYGRMTSLSFQIFLSPMLVSDIWEFALHFCVGVLGGCAVFIAIYHSLLRATFSWELWWHLLCIYFRWARATFC